MGRKGPPRAPPSPFEEVDSALGARVASGELSIEVAHEVATFVRAMAYSRRARGLFRAIERLTKELQRVRADLDRSIEAAHVASDACEGYLRAWSKLQGERIGREARAERDKTKIPAGDDAADAAYRADVARWRSNRDRED